MTQSATVIIEDLFLTGNFLIKGRMPHKYQRLTKLLEDTREGFLQVLDASMISLHGGQVIRTPSVMVNLAELVLAHELVDVAGDHALRTLAAGNHKSNHIRAFYNGVLQLELTGRIEAGAYEPAHNNGRRFFIMLDPVLRGLDLDSNPEFAVLKGLSYAIVRKSKLAYIYDFS
ncbi:MAG: hypothetical protein ACYTGW_00410 [Planctomycetota bacterium]|jgi:hypothetical protein